MRGNIVSVITVCLMLIAGESGATTVQRNLGPAAAPPSGVVGWWPGDGDARDITGNGQRFD